jgi:hypothetical protein
MAKVKIQGNASGAGIFTITPPATATDRTLTLPDATGTLLMTDGDGSSLTGITHTPADNSVTLAKMAHGTDGELITYDATGAPANVAVGTSGHILTSGGAGVAPTFQAAAAGGADTSLSNLTATGEKRVCHVWVHFKGTSTVTIQDSYNVSSITDNGTGDYTVNFSITMANDNFSWSIGGTYPGTVTEHRPFFVGAWSSTTHSNTLSTSHIRCASGLNYQPGLHSAALYDAELVSVAIFGD